MKNDNFLEPKIVKPPGAHIWHKTQTHWSTHMHTHTTRWRICWPILSGCLFSDFYILHFVLITLICSKNGQYDQIYHHIRFHYYRIIHQSNWIINPNKHWTEWKTEFDHHDHNTQNSSIITQSFFFAV